ncbi:MAG: GreA/GreB family elongation factor [Acidobacteriia bacterium]|nr:GreA/GreB family elongation factor [Terriglobia bacterium]
MSETPWFAEWDAVVAGGDAGKIEEFWLARLEKGIGDGEAFAEALKRLRSAGKKTLAATLLELAADEARSEGAWAGLKRFLCEMIRLGIGDGEKWRAGLQECLRHLWSGRPSLEKLLKHFPLLGSRKPVETLETLETWLEHDLGGVFSMAGRGPGRVVEANPQLGMLRLDFEKERRVPVPIDAARKYLTPLPQGHFLRRRLEERDALVAEIAGDPQGVLAAILESFAAPMNVPEIKAALSGLLDEAQWTSWWNRAKKNPRVVASGSGTRVKYRLASGGGAEEEIRAEFKEAGLAQQVELARRHGSRSRELGAFMAAEMLHRGQEAGAKPGLAWEALMLAARLGAPAAEVEAARVEVLGRAGALPLLDALGDAQQRETALEFVREHDAGGWTDVFAGWVEREGSTRLLSRISHALVDAGQTGTLQTFLDQVLLHPAKHPAALVWLCEEDSAGLLPLLEERRTGSLLVRLVELAERRAFSPFRARLKEILSAGGLAGLIVQERLTVDQARRILQILEHPGELADERNWLRRAATARFPELRQTVEADVVPALAGTVEKLQAELKNLLEKQIPETLRAIQEARSHGDFSENFEYHAARARQEFLSARASELQGDLAKVRIIDPAKVDTSRVRVGTRVWLRPQLTGARRAIVILGPYEADPEKGVLSHGSEAAQALLERAPGETVRFNGVACIVESIEPAL